MSTDLKSFLQPCEKSQHTGILKNSLYVSINLHRRVFAGVYLLGSALKTVSTGFQSPHIHLLPLMTISTQFIKSVYCTPFIKPVFCSSADEYI